MAKTEDISIKIQLLQEKLAKENETRDNVIPQSFGQSKRPNNCKDFFLYDQHFRLFCEVFIDFQLKILEFRSLSNG